VAGAVVISGASTGIGRACALRMAGKGFDVYAGVRKPEDGVALREDSPERLHPVILDVTDPASIDATAAVVREAVGDRGLAGLVNNAGITVQGPVEFVPLDDLRRQLEVNLVGQVAVIQALLPLIRTARGRIVNVTSVGGRVAHAFLSPYAASKYGMEAVTDALRRELLPWGIHVAAVEPGAVRTEIWRKGEDTADELLDSLGAEGRQLYGDTLQRLRGIANRMSERGDPPEAVAEVVDHALTARRPRTRYVVGREAKAQIALRAVLPDRGFDAIEARMLGLKRAAER
jgi:NAD(P)-dependent dehydrogenase (short-subunit alcohol dehydrogenase family)